ncbi:MAG TPA: hypothetical protein VJ829_03670 [Candidatus Binatia bacterium]|nr:hypothetical protein [Candidatus Binatia bacterium]
MSWSDFTEKLVTLGIAGFLLKILGAIAVWVIGRRLIHFAITFSMRALRRQAVEETLLVYIGSTISVLLNVALVIAILGYFGVETTTFAALVAGAGVAIGAAWGGLLANFAAGALLVVLRPTGTVTRLACAVLVLAICGCPLPPQPLPSSGVPGVYEARTPGADGNTRVVTLWLQSGGRVTLETVDLGKERAPVENGSWSAQGEEVTVTLDGESEPLVFGIQRDQLVPKRWDHNLYGDGGLLLTRRAR